MHTNTPFTLYSKVYDEAIRLDVWKRSVIDKALWIDSKGINVKKAGLESADSVNVYVPDVSLSFKVGDYIVKGVIDDEVTRITDLEKKYSDCHVITKVDKKDYGSKEMHHFELGGA